MFRVDLSTTECRLWMEVRGFWDVATAQSLLEEMQDALDRAARLGQPLELLSDCRDFPVQASAVLPFFADLALALQRAPVARHAVLLGTPLQRMQGKRMLSDTAFSVFETIEDACAWLGWTESDDIVALRSKPDATCGTAPAYRVR